MPDKVRGTENWRQVYQGRVVAAHMWTIGMVAVLAVYASLAFRDLWLPGLYYDELIQVVPALDVVRGGLWSNVNWVPSAEISLFGHVIPLMTMDYMGSLKTILFIPIVAMFGVTPDSVRVTTLSLVAVSIVVTFVFTRRVLGRPAAFIVAALLATDLSFIYYVRVDYGPTALMMFLKSVALWQLAIWWQEKRLRHLFVGAIALGLGVYNKADFLWIAFAICVAAALVAPNAVRMRITLRTMIVPLAGFMLGAAPLIYFNLHWPMPTLAALSGPATSGGPSGGFVDQLGERLGVLEHLLDGEHVLQGAAAVSPSTGIMVLLAVASVPVVLFAQTNRFRAGTGRPGFFALLATVIIVVAAAMTPGGYAGHHVILAYPFPQLLVAAGVVTAVRIARRRIHVELAAVAAVSVCTFTLGQNILTADRYLRRLDTTGGQGNFSDAIYSLESSLERDGSSAPVVDLDWGFHYPLVGLSQGKIHSIEAIDGSTSELRQFFDNPDVRYVAHAPAVTNFPRGLQGFMGAATAAGFQVVRERSFATRDGKPVIDVYVLRGSAATSQPGSRPGVVDLISNDGRGTVAQISSDDQVRVVPRSDSAQPTLLTIASAQTTYPINVPDQANLSFAVAQPENVWKVTTGAIATITVIDGERRQEIFRRRLSARDLAADRTWSDVSIDLSPFAGRTIILEFSAMPPPEGDNASWVIWRDPVVAPLSNQ